MTDEKKDIKDIKEDPSKAQGGAVAPEVAEDIKEDPSKAQGGAVAPEVKEDPSKAQGGAVAPKPVKNSEQSRTTPSGKPASTEPASGRFKDLIEKIEGLTALELSELVKALEERFGVSAAAPVAAAGAAAPAAAAAEEEKTQWTVVLANGGSNKIGAIKAVREVLPDLGLVEAKEMVEGAPKTLKENVATEEANSIKAKLEEAGAAVELK